MHFFDFTHHQIALVQKKSCGVLWQQRRVLGAALFVTIMAMMIAPVVCAASSHKPNAMITASSTTMPDTPWQPLADYVVANPTPHANDHAVPRRLSLEELRQERQKKPKLINVAEPKLPLDFAALPPLYNATRLKPVLDKPSVPKTAPTSTPLSIAAATTSAVSDQSAKPAATPTQPTMAGSATPPPAMVPQCAATTAATNAAQQDKATLAALHHRVTELKLQDQLGFLLPAAAEPPPAATPVSTPMAATKLPVSAEH
jgi:hypothetical protein